MGVKLTKVEPTALISAEVAYLGSFIRDEGLERSHDFFAMRSMIQSPHEMHDPFSMALLDGVIRLYAVNEMPTVDNLTELMLTQGLVTPELHGIAGDATAYNQLKDILGYYAVRGAKTMKSFRSKEKAVRENWRIDKLSPEAIAKVVAEASKTSTSSLDIALAVRNHISSLIGEGEVQSQTNGWKEQAEIFDMVPERQRGLIGKPRFTFPPHWQINHLIPTIKPGEKIVLSGGTGDGKSAMSMQFAEWCSIIGKNVLVIHMEDSVETILMRQTVRWIGGTLEELEKGDPRGRMAAMKELRQKWDENGGSITYKYLAGNSIPLIAEHIKETSRMLEAEGKHLDVVCMDYFQKADFDSGIKPGQSYVNVATAGAEELKILAQTLNLTMFVVSQETSDGNGGKHTAWTKALEQKPQIYISLTRRLIKKLDEEETVVLPDPDSNEPNKLVKMNLTKIGDRSIWTELHVKKVNQGRQGTQWLYFHGPRFRVFEPKFMLAVENGSRSEFEIPVLTPIDDMFWKRQSRMFEAYRAGYVQLEDPETKARKANEEAEAASAYKKKEDYH